MSASAIYVRLVLAAYFRTRLCCLTWDKEDTGALYDRLHLKCFGDWENLIGFELKMDLRCTKCQSYILFVNKWVRLSNKLVVDQAFEPIHWVNEFRNCVKTTEEVKLL